MIQIPIGTILNRIMGISYNYLDLQIKFFKHMQAWILSLFKFNRHFEIKSPPPENTLSIGT